MSASAPLRYPISAPVVGAEEKAAVAAVLESGRLASGPQVEAFEREFAEFCNASYAVMVSSGTAALQLALEATGLGSGSRVAVPAFTFAASANAVLAVGATPVFVDVGDDYCVHLEHLRAPHVGQVDAVMPVHLYGQLADMDPIRVWADEHDVAIVEDAAQAHGARHGHHGPAGRQAPAAYSFYATKNMMTGEGGAVVTSDAAVAESVRLGRNHGMLVRYHHERFGLNFRMMDLQAAIGRIQLRRLPELTARRRENAAAYGELLGPLAATARPNGGHVYHQYTIRVPQRDQVRAALAERGVGTEIYYPIPVHQQKSMADYAAGQSLPGCERAAAEVLSLPVHPGITSDDARSIGRTLLEILDALS